MEERPNQHSYLHPRSLLLLLVGELAVLVLLELRDATTPTDYALVLALAAVGALAFYVLARVTIAISRM